MRRYVMAPKSVQNHVSVVSLEHVTQEITWKPKHDSGQGTHDSHTRESANMRRCVMAPRSVQNQVSKILAQNHVPMVSLRNTVREIAYRPRLDGGLKYVYVPRHKAIARFVERVTKLRHGPIVIPDASWYHRNLIWTHEFAPVWYDQLDETLRRPDRIEEAAWALVMDMDILQYVRERYTSKDM